MTCSFISNHRCTVLLHERCVLSLSGSFVIRMHSYAAACHHQCSHYECIIWFYFMYRILVYLTCCSVPCQSLAGWHSRWNDQQAERFSVQATRCKSCTFMSSVRCHCGNAHATVAHMNFNGPTLWPVFGSFHLGLQWWMIELILCGIYKQNAKILWYNFLLKMKLCSRAWKGGHSRGSREVVPEGGVDTWPPAHCHAVRETQILPPACLSEQLALWLTAAVKGSPTVCSVCMLTPDQEHDYQPEDNLQLQQMHSLLPGAFRLTVPRCHAGCAPSWRALFPTAGKRRSAKYQPHKCYCVVD